MFQEAIAMFGVQSLILGVGLIGVSGYHAGNGVNIGKKLKVAAFGAAAMAIGGTTLYATTPAERPVIHAVTASPAY